MQEPLQPAKVKSLLVAMLEDGTVELSAHARQEMAKDNITEGEVMGVLQGGVVEPGEFEEAPGGIGCGGPRRMWWSRCAPKRGRS
jgi:hypothetical protein